MKLNVKTLKGTSFEIEATPEASVRSISPLPLVSISLQSRAIRRNYPAIRLIRGVLVLLGRGVVL